MEISEKYKRLRKPGVKDMHNLELLKACKEDPEILEEFLRLNKDFIFSIIIKYKGSIESLKEKFKVDEEELLQHAYIGVITALREFDPNKGYKFTTYVVRPILWEINQLLYNECHLVRLSRGAVELLKSIKEIEDKLGYSPNEDELSKILNVPVERVRETILFSKEVEHIDAFENFDIPDYQIKDIEEQIINRIYIEETLKKVNLTRFERKVIELIKEGLNNSQIANRLGVYPMTINRTINRIRDKIQNCYKIRKTSKYEDEINIISNEMLKQKKVLGLREIYNLLVNKGYDPTEYTSRKVYYIRQKAINRIISKLKKEDDIHE